MSGSYTRVGLVTVLDGIGGRAPDQFASRLAALRERAGRLNLEPDAVHLAAEIAALEPALDGDERYAAVLLVLASLAALNEGSTRLPIPGPAADAHLKRIVGALTAADASGAATTAALDAIAKLLASTRVGSIVGRSADSRTPLLLIDGSLYHQRIHAAQARLAQNLAALLRAGPPSHIDASRIPAAIAEVAMTAALADGHPAELTDSQRAAIDLALSRRLTVISGGPGSGKTTVVVAILRVLARLGVKAEQIALAAPTGKAAYRMREMISANLGAIENPDSTDAALRKAPIEPATIHRLLGYSPSRGHFRHHRNNPLAQRVVIVDEGSMMDLILMERLTGALGPEAQLIIVGDADQLPSVTAGAVLRDLVPRGGNQGHPMAGCVAVLLGTHRTSLSGEAGVAIAAVAGAIRDGDTAVMDTADAGGKPLVQARATPGAIAFEGVEHFDAATGDLERFLVRWQTAAALERAVQLAGNPFAVVEGRIAAVDRDRAAELFALLSRARILTAVRAGPVGAEGVNARLHALACARAGISPSHAMIAGEPVIVLRNDYERQLFNGDHGMVVNIASANPSEAVSGAVFVRDGEFVCYRGSAMQDRLALAYAMTVHKAQGSEFDTVAIVMPPRSEAGGAPPILTRELLYTAVTRARRSAVIIGEREMVAAAIANPVARDSGLAQALESALAAAVS